MLKRRNIIPTNFGAIMINTIVIKKQLNELSKYFSNNLEHFPVKPKSYGERHKGAWQGLLDSCIYMKEG